MRYAIVRENRIAGIVNYDGVSAHPYGDVDLRGPVPDDAKLEDLMWKAWSEVEAPSAVPHDDMPPIPAPAKAEAMSFDHDGDGHAGGSISAQPVNPPMTAAQLIAASEAKPPMPWFTFKAEAKRILGNDPPEKKPDIIAALNKL